MNRVDICLQDEVPAVKSLQKSVWDGVVLSSSSGWLHLTWRESISSSVVVYLVFVFCLFGFCFCLVCFLDIPGQNVPSKFDMLAVDSSFA